MGDLSKFSDTDLLNIVTSNAEEELEKRGYKYGWYKEQQYAGVIYILVNPAFPQIVKIGYTDNLSDRIRQLSNTNVPDTYHCYAIYKVKKRLEDLRLHKLIDSLDSSLRHVKNKEFYDMPPEKAYDILSAIAQINGDENLLIKNPFNDNYFVSKAESKPPEVYQHKKTRLTFKMLNIPVGSTLTLATDAKITVQTYDDNNQVIYNGNIYSLSGIAKKLLHIPTAHGGRHFKYNGKTLVDIREEMGV